MQPQGHLQMLVNLVDLGMAPQQALDMPRWQLAGPDPRPGHGLGALEAGGLVQLEEGWDAATLRDLERRDTGRLNWWGLEIEYEKAGGLAQGSAQPALAIPDANPQGVQSDITISESGQANDIQVTVAIRHSYRGDLLVEVVAPSGRSAVLHDRTGGAGDDLRATYDRATTPALAALLGEPIRGKWTLRVCDLAAMDTGFLENWTLQLRYRS